MNLEQALTLKAQAEQMLREAERAIKAATPRGGELIIAEMQEVQKGIDALTMRRLGLDQEYTMRMYLDGSMTSATVRQASWLTGLQEMTVRAYMSKGIFKQAVGTGTMVEIAIESLKPYIK